MITRSCLFNLHVCLSFEVTNFKCRGLKGYFSEHRCLTQSVSANCLSVFSPFSFLDIEKPKCRHSSDLGTCWIICNFTNLVTAFSLATCGVCHFSLCEICTSERRTKDDGHAWADGNCSSNFLPLFHFAAAEKTFLPRRPIAETDVSRTTSRHLSRLRIP